MDQTAISNLALAKLGERPIASIEDEGRVAVLCSTNLPIARDAVLEARPWTFAVARRSIAAAGDAPEWGPTKRFPLDPTILRVLEVADGDAYELSDWRLEGRYIVTDYEGPVKVRVVEQVEDPTLWTPGFVQAVAAYLAFLLAVPLTENRSLKADLWAEYQTLLKAAGAVDGVQGRTPKRLSSSWSRLVRW